MNESAVVFAQYVGAAILPPCAYCGRPARAIDHIHPRNKGGTDAPSNLAPACQRCNSSKSDKTVCEWTSFRIRRFLRRMQKTQPLASLHQADEPVVESAPRSPDGLTWHQWIAKQTDRDDPIGDIARDWQADRARPRSNQGAKIFFYLTFICHACSEAIDAFRDAWFEFCGERFDDGDEEEADEEYEACSNLFQPVPTLDVRLEQGKRLEIKSVR